MRPPVDYPETSKLGTVASIDDMTYAALLDRHDSDLVITAAMIQSACVRIETAQQLPSAAKPEPVSSIARHKPVLSRLINAIR